MYRREARLCNQCSTATRPYSRARNPLRPATGIGRLPGRTDDPTLRGPRDAHEMLRCEKWMGGVWSMPFVQRIR
jgi:hypothetical protein